MDEASRIKEAYARRDILGKDKVYTLFNPPALFINQQREREILSILSRFNINSLSDKKILDLGCGNGGVLRDFIRYGARPANCYGIDLLPDRIEKAKSLSLNIDFRCGNAEKLPYEDSFFDIVLCFTVFTSIFDNNMKRNIASEMLRVLKPVGIILWYDFHMNNPQNPDVKGIGRREIEKLFPNCHIDLRRITLAAPITRMLAPYSLLLCYLLEKIPILRTHYLGVIKKDEKISEKPKPQTRY